jgi:hypothetical protein
LQIEENWHLLNRSRRARRQARETHGLTPHEVGLNAVYSIVARR